MRKKNNRPTVQGTRKDHAVALTALSYISLSTVELYRRITFAPTNRS
jgi:hypothetical protein